MNILPNYIFLKRGCKYANESQESLVVLFNMKNDDFLDSKYKEYYTFNNIIERMIHHHIYHLGQIEFVISLHKILN
jgi:hypothetical protein